MPSFQRWRTICVVVQTPQQEDKMHNHEKPAARQRNLHFEDEEVWTMLPEEVRERCRGLEGNTGQRSERTRTEAR